MTRGFQLSSRAKYKTKPLAVAKDSELKPQRRRAGGWVTMRNCTSIECRWPYGEPGADMVMCGRPKRGAAPPYCAEHQKLVGRKGGGIY